MTASGVEPGVAQRAEGEPLIALRELLAPGVDDQRHVGVGRGLAAEGLDQLDLPRRRSEQVGAAHHVVDLHREIVHHHRELIGLEPVAALQHEVPHRQVHPLRHRPVNAIGERNRPVVDAETDAPRPAVACRTAARTNRDRDRAAAARRGTAPPRRRAERRPRPGDPCARGGRGRGGRPRRAAGVPLRRTPTARTGCTERRGRRRPAPRPNRGRARRDPRSVPPRCRAPRAARSRSSSRQTNVPPRLRTESHAASAVRALPTWIIPVGDGA